MLIDTHSHLDRYPRPTLDAMLARAAAAGVSQVITVGFDLESAAAGLAIARRSAPVSSAVGLHPRAVPAAGLTADDLARLRSLATGDGNAPVPEVVAIGEIGLDSQAPAGSAVQRAAFVAQLRLARELSLPVNLHVWEWHDELLDVLRQEPPSRGAVVHYFQGDWALARRYLELGCLISVGKPASRPELTALRDAIRRAPLTALLLETDTYPLPGRATEPKDVAAIAAAVAELRGTTTEAIAEATTANARRLFGR